MYTHIKFLTFNYSRIIIHITSYECNNEPFFNYIFSSYNAYNSSNTIDFISSFPNSSTYRDNVSYAVSCFGKLKSRNISSVKTDFSSSLEPTLNLNTYLQKDFLILISPQIFYDIDRNLLFLNHLPV